MRKVLSAASALLALTLAATPPPAQAQMAVVDVKAILQAEQQVSNELTQIQRLESQLTNQAAMLQKLQTDVTGPITQIASQATGILQQAQGIGYGAQNIAGQYAKPRSEDFETRDGQRLTTFRGDLAVHIPGEGTVALAGPEFRAALCDYAKTKLQRACESKVAPPHTA